MFTAADILTYKDVHPDGDVFVQVKGPDVAAMQSSSAPPAPVKRPSINWGDRSEDSGEDKAEETSSSSSDDQQFLDLYHTPREDDEETPGLAVFGPENRDTSDIVSEEEQRLCVSCVAVEKMLIQIGANISLLNGNGTSQDPVTKWPNKSAYFERMKYLVNIHRRTESTPCVCKNLPKFHRSTGRANAMVLSISFAFHVSRMCSVEKGHTELIRVLEENYQNWKRYCVAKRNTKTKRILLDKIERYEEILTFNRFMYKED